MLTTDLGMCKIRKAGEGDKFCAQVDGPADSRVDWLKMIAALRLGCVQRYKGTYRIMYLERSECSQQG